MTCRKAYQLCGMSVEEFATAGPVRQLRRGEVICAVGDCARPCRNNSITLCQVHDNQRKRLDLSAPQFVNHPAAQPLPGFGVCRVPVCDRQARYLRGLCGTHYARWWDQDRKGLTTDFDAWCRTAAPIASGHAVIMRGLSSAVQAEILFGLQERCRRGVITYLYQLRIFTRHLRVAGVVSIADFDVAQLPRHVRRLGQELQDAISRGSTAEAEQHKDVWDMSVFGHGRKRLDFTVIAQPWLRDAAKHWVLEELPLRRGPNIVGVLRDHVNSIGVLGNSLRLHRPDEGMHPAVLGRADIVAFLNRLKHQESTGLISGYRRRKIAQHAALVLRECRAMGLARPDRPMAGLDPEFAFRRNDLPPVPNDDGPGRALPDSVLAALIAALDRLASLGGTRCPRGGPTAHRHRPPASRDLPPAVGLPRPGPRRQVRADLHRLQEQPRRTPAGDQRRHRRIDHRTQTAGAGTLPGHSAGRSRAAATGIPQPRGNPVDLR